jgi:hypothetical protein
MRAWSSEIVVPGRYGPTRHRVTAFDREQEHSSMTDIVVDSTAPETLRAQLVDRLRTHGWITDPVVAAAFARVPRHLFTPPGTSLSAAYADDTVATKRGPDGRTLSSISAPWLSLSTLMVL